MSGIYQIRNAMTGAVYVGSTADFNRRKVDHFKRLRAGNHPSSHLQNSVSKHGLDVFMFEILVECEVERLLDMEQVEIDRVLDSAGRAALYNANPIAARTEWTEESKEKLRLKRVGQNNPFFGKKHTPESGASMSASRLGRPTWNKGKKATQEHRAAISAAGMGRVQSEETKKKRSETMRRKVISGELFGLNHRANMAIGQQNRHSKKEEIGHVPE